MFILDISSNNTSINDDISTKKSTQTAQENKQKKLSKYFTSVYENLSFHFSKLNKKDISWTFSLYVIFICKRILELDIFLYVFYM